MPETELREDLDEMWRHRGITVHERWCAVMRRARSLGKNQEMNQPGARFKFRGFDDALDLFGPIMRDVGLFIIPGHTSLDTERYMSSKDKPMKSVVVKSTFTVYGIDGDSFVGECYGEASDSSDKAVSKAGSVAMRQYLFYAAGLPTGDPDADSEYEERSHRSPADVARGDVIAWLGEQGYAQARAVNMAIWKFWSLHKEDIRQTDNADRIRRMLADMKADPQGFVNDWTAYEAGRAAKRQDQNTTVQREQSDGERLGEQQQ